MGTDPVDILSRHKVPRHRLTRRDYYRIGEAGVLGENDRVELLEGQLVDMSPISPRHAIITDNLHDLLAAAFAGRAKVRGQNPVVLNDGSEPQPDIAVARRPWLGYPHEHPTPDDIFLLIEVADSSLAFDRTVKLELYARAKIREVWIVDLTADVVMVHRAPSGGGYGSVIRVVAPGMLDVEGLPGAAIPVADVFA
jgi:Uma2 family endonuclease